MTRLPCLTLTGGLLLLGAALTPSSTGADNPKAPPRTDAHGDPLPADALGRIGTTRWSLGEDARILQLSADGQRLLVSSPSGPARVWDVATGKELRRLEGKAANTYDLSADGKRLAAVVGTASSAFDVDSGKQLCQAPGGTARLSPDGRFLATSAYDAAAKGQKVSVTDIDSGKVVQSWPLTGLSVRVFSFSPDGTVVAGAGFEGFVYLWDRTTGKEVRRFGGHRSGIDNLIFAPDGKQLASASNDGTVRTWDAATGKELRRFGRLSVADEEPRFTGYQVAFAADGKQLLVVGGSRNVVDVYDLASGDRLRQVRLGRTLNFPITLSGAGLLLADATGPNGAVHVWELAAGKELTPDRPTGFLRSLAASSDGRLVALGCLGRSATIWHAGSGKSLHDLVDNLGEARALAFSPDNALVATASGNGTTVALWDVASAKIVRELPGHLIGASRLWFAPDGKTLLTLDYGPTLRRWDIATGKKVEELPLKGPVVAVSGDGKRAAVRIEEQLPGPNIYHHHILDTASGKVLCQLPSDGLVGANTFALSPDGRCLAILMGDRSLRLFSATTGALLQTMPPPAVEPMPGRVISSEPFVVFSRDGRSLVAAERSKAVRVYEVITGKERRRLEGHQVSKAIFTGNDRLLVTASNDGTTLTWDLCGPSPAGKLTAADLDAHWATLAGNDGSKAFRAIVALHRAPAQAVPYLKERLKPVEPADPKQVAQLLTDLDDKDFTVRQKATEHLEKLGDLAEDALRKALAGKPALETRQRLERLLAKVQGQQLTADGIRTLRCVEVLEQAATPEARQLLDTIAGGAPGARLTNEAQAALQRLGMPRVP